MTFRIALNYDVELAWYRVYPRLDSKRLGILLFSVVKPKVAGSLH